MCIETFDLEFASWILAVKDYVKSGYFKTAKNFQKSSNLQKKFYANFQNNYSQFFVIKPHKFNLLIYKKGCLPVSRVTVIETATTLN